MLPFLSEGSQNSKKYIIDFQGLNMSEGYADGELSDCTNLSSALAPCISQRFARTAVGDYEAPTALHTKDGLFVIDGTDAIYDGNVVGQVSTERKQIATIGNYIIIFPDKKYYRVPQSEHDVGEFGLMEETFTGTGLVFTDSTITTTGTFHFRVGDTVTISGCATAENNRGLENTAIIRGATDKTLTFYANTFAEATEAGAVTIKRNVPDLDFICESNYRLWGTKGKTIFGSKYGDPFNFYYYDTGLSDASYWIDVGTDGEFTGCIPFSSYICFFKENTLHKLYGSKPSNYQIVTSQVFGVQSGCERSLRVINETLFYKGVNGVYAYAGGVPELISAKFGTARFAEACAESDGERYYISMRRGNDWGLYVYDVMRGVWLKEDDMHCVDMAFHDGKMYLLSADRHLYRIDMDGDKSDIEWSATFCPFTEMINERKGYSRFHMRLELAAGAWLSVEVKRDRAQKWSKVYTTHNERARTITVPILPARCDSVEIRLSGKGACIIRTFVREFFAGSDV